MFRMLERGPKFEERSPHHFNFALKSPKNKFCPAFNAVRMKRLAGIYQSAHFKCQMNTVQL